MGLVFEWDERKAAENVSKHKVSFEEACRVFGDPLSLTIPEPRHSEDEERFVVVGQSAQRRLIVVVHAEREDNIRIISARRATTRERRAYEEDTQSK